MTEPKPSTSSRRFTKIVVMINLLLVWALMFTSIIFDQTEHVIGSGFALIGTLFGIYTGIGHLDFRKAAQMSLDKLVKGDGK